MRPDPRTGTFSETDMRRGGNPIWAVTAAVAIGALIGLTGCAGSPVIAALSGQAVINPPPGLMAPTEPFVPLLWPGAGPVPAGDEALQPVPGQGVAPAVTRPVAALPRPGPVDPVKIPPRVAPATATPAAPPVAPGPAGSGPKEIGKAPFPAAPPH